MNYYNEIKKEIINNETTKIVKNYSINRSDLTMRYNIGKLLSEAEKKYGEGIIKKYSIKLTSEFGKGYNTSDLKRMRQFYLLSQKGVASLHRLNWVHIIALLPLNNINEVNYYVDITINYNLGYRELRQRIKNKEYERLSNETKSKLINKEIPTIQEIVKDPIIIKNTTNKEIVTEKMLQKLIMEDIPSFLEELGTGFTFIKNEYKIKIGSEYNYIDILLYNIKYKCYVVLELKVTKLKKQHIGQIEVYMNYIDKNLKSIEENKTVGIIICKKNNKFIMEYCSDKKIISKEYELV